MVLDSYNEIYALNFRG